MAATTRKATNDTAKGKQRAPPPLEKVLKKLWAGRQRKQIKATAEAIHAGVKEITDRQLEQSEENQGTPLGARTQGERSISEGGRAPIASNSQGTSSLCTLRLRMASAYLSFWLLVPSAEIFPRLRRA